MEFQSLYKKIFCEPRVIKSGPFINESGSNVGDLTPSNLLYIINKIIEELEDGLININQEAAVVSRLVYLHKNPFKHDKGYKALHKLNSLLRKYRLINILDMLYKIKFTVSGENGPRTKEMEWCLSYLLCFNHIFSRIVYTAEEAGYYFLARLKEMDHWNVMIVFLSVVSRVRQISLFYSAESAVWYNKLYKYLSVCQRSPKTWLPAEITLPKFIGSDLNSSEESDGVEENNVGGHTTLTPKSVMDYVTCGEDVGVVISRNNPTEGAQKKIRKRVAPFKPGLLNNLKSVESVREFMIRERLLRKRDVRTGLFYHLFPEEWDDFNNSVSRHLRKISQLSNKKAIHTEINKIKSLIRHFCMLRQ